MSVMKPNTSLPVAPRTIREGKNIAHGDQPWKLLLPPPAGLGMGFARAEMQRLHPSWILSGVSTPIHHPRHLEH